MAFTCSGTSFCSTVAASMGTALLGGGAALVPPHALRNARAAPAKSATAARCHGLLVVISSTMFLLPSMIPVVRFRCRRRRGRWRRRQHSLQPQVGKRGAYLLDGKCLITFPSI